MGGGGGGGGGGGAKKRGEARAFKRENHFGERGTK